jgi:hypothetical protein
LSREVFGMIPDAVVLCSLSEGNGLLTVFSVSSMNISVYIMGKFAIISLPLIV